MIIEIYTCEYRHSNELYVVLPCSLTCVCVCACVCVRVCVCVCGVCVCDLKNDG